MALYVLRIWSKYPGQWQLKQYCQHWTSVFSSTWMEPRLLQLRCLNMNRIIPLKIRGPIFRNYYFKFYNGLIISCNSALTLKCPREGGDWYPTFRFCFCFCFVLFLFFVFYLFFYFGDKNFCNRLTCTFASFGEKKSKWNPLISIN